MSSQDKIAFDYAIAEVKQVYEGAPDGQKLFETIKKSFEKHYDNPPVADFENILQKNFSKEEVR
jgi:hypothetical protein